jgi:Lrp/AsnC family transcriptional regulator, leucine-responsive regulatory protein
MSISRSANMGLDGYDIKLLDALQENNQRGSEELASIANLSPASCLRRVKRLRDNKVITADVSVVAPEALGLRMTMIVLISLEREQHDLIDAIKLSMKRSLKVTQCYYVTGTADFVIMVSVKNMDEYEQFTRDFFFENRNIRRFETLVVMNKTKAQLDVRASEAIEI